jgi:hypothetical protein
MDDAKAMLERAHPLGMGRSCMLALGIFWDEVCEGVATWGSPIVNNAVQRYGLRSDECLELRKMWLSDRPEKNAESRALAVMVRLIAKKYGRLRLLLTYCESDEKAAAYRGAGWIPQQAYRYLREILLPDGKTLSLRDFNRKGGKKTFGENWKGTYVNRRKWIYVLDKSLAPLVQSSMPVNQAGDGGSRPTEALHICPHCGKSLTTAQDLSAESTETETPDTETG